MIITTLQIDIARPHLGRIELECRVSLADIRAHVMQVVKELAKDAEVPGFRKGQAPLKRVQAHYIKDVRARALARLVESPPSPRLRRVNIQSALRAGRRPSIAARSALRRRVGKKYRVLGSPKPEYDKDARLDELASFEVHLAYDIDPMSDDLLAPKGLVNAPDTGDPPSSRETGLWRVNPGAGPPGAHDLGLGGLELTPIP
jgi:hypothetical protein